MRRGTLEVGRVYRNTCTVGTISTGLQWFVAFADRSAMTYSQLLPGSVLQIKGRHVVVRAVEPCGAITDVQLYDGDPNEWHTFASDDLAPT